MSLKFDKQFGQIISLLPATTAILDSNGSILTTNSSWDQFALENGIPDPSQVGAGVNYLDVCRKAGEEGHPFLAGIQQVLNGEVRVFTLEYPCHSPTQKRWFLLKMVPLPPFFKGAIVFHINITDRVLAEEKVRQLSQAKSDFLTRISHELRTPLNAMLGYAQLLNRPSTKSLPTDQSEYVDRIMIAGDHLLHLFNEILDLSTIESGTMSFNPKRVSLRKVIEDTTALIRPQSDRNGINLIVPNSDLKDVELNTDPTRLKQALLNLLSNAIKYNKPQGTVTLTCSRVPDNHIAICVEDTGPGISENQIPHLFEPFFKGEQGLVNPASTGLGLAITKKLVDLLGGRIKVESQPGKGSRFTVTLPL